MNQSHCTATIPATQHPAAHGYQYVEVGIRRAYLVQTFTPSKLYKYGTGDDVFYINAEEQLSYIIPFIKYLNQKQK